MKLKNHRILSEAAALDAPPKEDVPPMEDEPPAAAPLVLDASEQPASPARNSTTIAFSCAINRGLFRILALPEQKKLTQAKTHKGGQFCHPIVMCFTLYRISINVFACFSELTRSRKTSFAPSIIHIEQN
jgi:hypothetical protein